MPYANNNITFHISGGRIIGVENGDLCSNESYKPSQRRAYQGRCLAIVQTTTEGGEIEFIAKSSSLESCKFVIVKGGLPID